MCQVLQPILIPIIENRFYYFVSDQAPKGLFNTFFFNIDQDLAYHPYNQDFGPLSLKQIRLYLIQVQKLFKDQSFKDKTIYHVTSTNYKKCTNSALLCCIVMIVLYGKTAEQAFQPFISVDFKKFRDASFGPCSYQCSILDCLKGLQTAISLGWFDWEKLKNNSNQSISTQNQVNNGPSVQYQEKGDIDWIIPGKMAAFSSPHQIQEQFYGRKFLSAMNYVQILKRKGIKTVIRLNSHIYNRETFIKNKIAHFDLHFQDGTSPNTQIISQFFNIVDSSQLPIAIHCKAGLGRTGCLIGCYALRQYKFKARDFIGWIRLCRPGSILGPQQHFLLEQEKRLFQNYTNNQNQDQLDVNYINAYSLKTSSQQKIDINQQIIVNDQVMNQKQKFIKQNGDKGQGERLMQRKRKRITKNQKYYHH